MRPGGRYRASAPRLLAASLLCCVLALAIPASAGPIAVDGGSSQPSVSIEIPRSSMPSPDAWVRPPVIAQLIPQGPGIVWYRFGAGPGPWERSYGYVAVPEGKQLLSAVLVSPDGDAGPVSQVVTRSDIRATDIAEGPLQTAAATSRARYSGAPAVAGSVSVRVVIGSGQLGAVVRRLGGDNRYATSAAISASAFKTAPTVILATGEKFPDALTASGLAGAMNAPVLLARRTSIPVETRGELRRLKTKRVIICGGSPAVSRRAERQLRAMGIKTERLAGKTRYETAVAISKRISRVTGRANRVYLVRGDRFADALVISPLAYATRTPILLTTTSRLSPATASRLKSGHYRQVVVVGGSLSSRAKKSIRKRVRAMETWGGGGTYDTAAQIAARTTLSGQLSWKYVGIARGESFSDGLCGAAVAGKRRGVILLTPSRKLAPQVANALAAHAADIDLCDIYGGKGAISDGVRAEIAKLLH